MVCSAKNSDGSGCAKEGEYDYCRIVYRFHFVFIYLFYKNFCIVRSRHLFVGRPAFSYHTLPVLNKPVFLKLFIKTLFCPHGQNRAKCININKRFRFWMFLELLTIDCQWKIFFNMFNPRTKTALSGF
jgi:hypothetical protein